MTLNQLKVLLDEGLITFTGLQESETISDILASYTTEEIIARFCTKTGLSAEDIEELVSGAPISAGTPDPTAPPSFPGEGTLGEDDDDLGSDLEDDLNADEAEEASDILVDEQTSSDEQPSSDGQTSEDEVTTE